MPLFPRCVSLLLALFASALAAAPTDPLPRLRVSADGRHLETESGTTFFWLGDTAWRLIERSSREGDEHQPPVARYFTGRAAAGFNVIQTVLHVGATDWPSLRPEPFVDGDFTRPRVLPGPDNDFWDYADWIIAEMARYRLYVALLPLWLNNIPAGHALEREPSAAYRYGHYVGERYRRHSHVIWVLGGDANKQQGRNVENPARLALVRAMAEGIADGVNGDDQFDGRADWSTTLMTFHPPGSERSASVLHREPWLAFNWVQTATKLNFANYRFIERDYALEPPKPTLDSEVAYETSFSLRPEDPRDRRISPWDVRRGAYWAVFAGACGHTYGHRSFIGWMRRGETYRAGAHVPWYESLDAPGARQMAHLKRLIEAMPRSAERVPDQALLASDPGRGNAHVRALRARDGEWALVYSPSGGAFSLHLDRLAGRSWRATWFDPRAGTRSESRLVAAGALEFVPPSRGEDHDWVLVLSAARE